MEARLAGIGRGLLVLIVGAAAVAAPMLVIRSDDLGTGVDYYIHAWMIGYHGEAWNANRAFPPVYNSDGQVGAALPVFYGGILYKAAGLLSAVWGCHVALRLIALFSLAAVYAVVRHTARGFGTGEVFSAVAACAACWATYPLTNLYNRSAFPEFFAGAMLTCSCCLWGQFFLRPGPFVRWYTALAAALFLALAASAHPITGMLSVLIVGLIYVAHWAVPVGQRPGVVRRHAALLGAGLLVCGVLSPWLYAYRALGSQLSISGTLQAPSYLDLPARTTAWVRLFPLPFDYHQMTPGAPQLGTRHLDAQVNLPLLGLAAVALVGAYRAAGRGHRPRLLLAATAVGLVGLGAFVLSVSPEAEAALPTAARRAVAKLQFAYRLVATVDVAILVLLLLAMAFRHAAISLPGRMPWGAPPVALAVVFTLSACGLLQKSMNGRAACQPHGFPTDRADPAYERWLGTTDCAAGWAYFTPDCAPRLTPDEAARLQTAEFPVGTGREFGRARPAHVALAADAYVGTQAVPFRWGTFKVDGNPVPAWNLRTWQDARRGVGVPAVRVAVPVPAGTHTVEYAFAPPRKWRMLNAAADWMWLGWLAALAVWPVVRLIRGLSERGSLPEQAGERAAPPAEPRLAA